MRRSPVLAFGLCLLLVRVSIAAALPEPLTLADALQHADYRMPALQVARAALAQSEAERDAAAARSGIQAGVRGQLRVVEPSSASDNDDWNDSAARLYLRKRLYDAGYTRALQSAADSGREGARMRYLDVRQQRHLEIMRAFFDVVLSDLEFARDNEAMSIAFVQADRAQTQHELKRLSDVELLRLQADYQEVRSRRFVSEARQRRARSKLAIAMGRPDDLVSEVVPPQMPDTRTGLPAYETLVQAALDGSAALRALRAGVDAARNTLAAERARGGLLVTAEAEAAWYQRPTGSTHPLGAGLLLELPFDTDGAKRAAVALARARLTQAEAELALARQELRQEVLELWQLLDAKRVELEELAVLQDYRELYLDRSRALYELEVKSDLGDAMTQISAVRLQQGEAQFEWLMAKARLDALAGHLLIEETEL